MRKIHGSPCITIFCVVMCICKAAYSAELHVSPAGTGHYLTISEAIEAAEDGDTIVVHPGVYREYFSVEDKNLTVRSVNPWDLDTIKTTIVQGNIALPSIPYSVTVQGLTVRGGQIFGPYNLFNGEYMPEDSTSYVQNCIVQRYVLHTYGNVGEGAVIGVGGGVSNCLVWHNHVASDMEYEGQWWTALGAGIAQSHNISHCVIMRNSAYGVDGGGGGGLFDCINVHNSIIMENTRSPFYPQRLLQGIANEAIFNCTIIGEDRYSSAKNSVFYMTEETDWIPTGVELTYSLTDNLVDGEGNITTAPVFLSGYRLAAGSPGVDGGDPDPAFNDAHRPPAQGTERNDMGAYGGPGAAPLLFGGDNWPLLDDDGDGAPNICELETASLLLTHEEPWTNRHLADSDGDGLLDGQEHLPHCAEAPEPLAMTNPRLWDTDGNGFSDGLEVLVMGTDPLDPSDPDPDDPDSWDLDGDGAPAYLDPDDGNPDTDGDGFADGYELQQLTDPTDPESVPALGDLNGDGVSNNLDAAMLFQYVLGGIGPDAVPALTNADVLIDGVINNLDAVTLFNWTLRNFPLLPVRPQG